MFSDILLPPTSAQLHLFKAYSMALTILASFSSLSTKPSPFCQNQTSFSIMACWFLDKDTVALDEHRTCFMITAAVFRCKSTVSRWGWVLDIKWVSTKNTDSFKKYRKYASLSFTLYAQSPKKCTCLISCRDYIYLSLYLLAPFIVASIHRFWEFSLPTSRNVNTIKGFLFEEMRWKMLAQRKGRYTE